MGLGLLIPLSIIMGLGGLAVFFWAMRGGQYDDPDGAAWRVLEQEDPMEPDGHGLRPAPDTETETETDPGKGEG